MSERQQQGLDVKAPQSKPGDEGVEYEYESIVHQHSDSRNKQPLQYQGSMSPNSANPSLTNRERDEQDRREYEWHMAHSRLGPGLGPPAGRTEKRAHVDERVSQRGPPRGGDQRRYDYVEYEDYNDGRKSYGRAEYEGYNDGSRRREQVEQEDYNTGRRRYGHVEIEDYGNGGRRYGYAENEEYNSGRRSYGYTEPEDYNNEAIRNPNLEYGYNDGVQTSKGEWCERRCPADNDHGAMVRKLVHVEDGVAPEPVRLHPDRGHVHGYRQSSQGRPTLEIQSPKEENDRYQERLPEELHMDSYYNDKEKHAHHSRKISHASTPPQYKDLGNQYLPKGAPPSISSDAIRDHLPRRPRDGDTHPYEGYPRNPGKLSENLGTQEYGQRPQLELTRKDYEAGYADMNCQQCDHYGYTWNEPEDYVYVNSESRGKDDPAYITHEASYRENRAPARKNFEHRYMQKVAIAKPMPYSPTEAEGSQKVYSRNGLRDRDNSQKEEIPGYDDLRRPYGTSAQESDCLNSGYAPAEFAGRASQDFQHNQSSDMHKHEISGHGHGRHTSVARTQGERKRISAELVDFEDMQRNVEPENRYADEHAPYTRMVKRKYVQDEDARGLSLGTKPSDKWSAYSGSQQIEVCRPEWNNVSSSSLHSQVPSGREPNLFLEAKDVMDEIYHGKNSERYGWSDQGKCENMQEHSAKSFESRRKYMKIHPKSESSKGYGRSHYINYRNDRQHYAGRRGEDENHMNVVAQARNLSNPNGPLKFDPCEDSEGFKQSVLAAFLIYTKKLNENPPVRKLYKEQGNCGTLFCIVCGRSSSKAFRDTEGLVRHASMTRKAGLRAHHLGLNRAICVLMGWNTEIPRDVVTWMPLPLPRPEAMAQKEDLIIWQPIVIVHNISLSNNNHKEWKVISLEALEGIVRGKSFIKSKIKICLGYPGDQSVMLVKFLATFTGLLEAEKLHKYFTEKGQGRAEFEQALLDMNSSGGDPSQIRAQEETEGDESLLYGYMGIAEDLDRIDLDTKKRCKIQSKREIQAIADAPLKKE